MDFVWSGQHFDTNGFLYWVGTNKGTENWTNPAKTNPPRVVVTSSGNGEGTPADVCNRTQKNCSTNSNSEGFFEFDFSASGYLSVSHYTIRFSSAGCYLRNWKLLGSNDGEIWEVLMHHQNDTALNSSWAVHTWEVGHSMFYSHFRIQQSGGNDDGSTNLYIANVEFYGRLQATCLASDTAHNVFRWSVARGLEQLQQQPAASAVTVKFSKHLATTASPVESMQYDPSHDQLLLVTQIEDSAQQQVQAFSCSAGICVNSGALLSILNRFLWRTAGLIGASPCQRLLSHPIDISVPCLTGHSGGLLQLQMSQMVLGEKDLVCRVQVPQVLPQFVRAQIGSVLDCCCLVRTASVGAGANTPAVVPLKLDKSGTGCLVFVVTAAVDLLKSCGPGTYCFVNGSELPSAPQSQLALDGAPELVRLADDGTITGPPGSQMAAAAAAQLVAVGSPVDSALLLVRESQMQLVFNWESETFAQPLLASPSGCELVSLVLDTATVKAMVEGLKLVKRAAHRKALLPQFVDLAQHAAASGRDLHKLRVNLRNVCAAVQQLCVSQELTEFSLRPALEQFREKVLRMQHLMFGEGYSQGNNLEIQRLLSFSLWPHKFTSPDPFSLANAGLCFGGSPELQDSCVHFESGTVINHWQQGDNPWVRLRQASSGVLPTAAPQLNVPLSATLGCSLPLQHSSDEQPVSFVSALVAAPVMASASLNGRVVLWESSLGLRPLNAFNVLHPGIDEPSTSQRYHCLLDQPNLSSQTSSASSSITPDNQPWQATESGMLSVEFCASLTPEMDSSLVLQLKAAEHQTEGATWFELRWSEDAVSVLKCSTPSSDLHGSNHQATVTAMLEQTLVASVQLGSESDLWQYGGAVQLWMDVKDGCITCGKVADDGKHADPILEYSDSDEPTLKLLSSLSFSSPTESLCTVSSVVVKSSAGADRPSQMELLGIQVCWQWIAPCSAKSMICDDVAVYVVAAMSDGTKNVLRLFDGSTGCMVHSVETASPVCSLTFEEADGILVTSAADHRQLTTYNLSGGSLVLRNTVDSPQQAPLGSLQLISSWSIGSVVAGIVQGGGELQLVNPATLSQLGTWAAPDGCSIGSFCSISGRSELGVTLDNYQIEILTLESVSAPTCEQELPTALELTQDSLHALISQLEFGPVAFRAHSLSPELRRCARSSVAPIVAHLSTEHFGAPLGIRLQMQQWTRVSNVEVTLSISVGAPGREQLVGLPPCTLQLSMAREAELDGCSTEAPLVLNESSDMVSCVLKFERPVLAHLMLHMLDATVTLPARLAEVGTSPSVLTLEVVVHGASGSEWEECQRAAHLHSLLLKDEDFASQLSGVIQHPSSSFALRMCAMDLVTALSRWMHSLSSIIDIQQIIITCYLSLGGAVSDRATSFFSDLINVKPTLQLPLLEALLQLLPRAVHEAASVAGLQGFLDLLALCWGASSARALAVTLNVLVHAGTALAELRSPVEVQLQTVVRVTGFALQPSLFTFQPDPEGSCAEDHITYRVELPEGSAIAFDQRLEHFSSKTAPITEEHATLTFDNTVKINKISMTLVAAQFSPTTKLTVSLLTKPGADVKENTPSPKVLLKHAFTEPGNITVELPDAATASRCTLCLNVHKQARSVEFCLQLHGQQLFDESNEPDTLQKIQQASKSTSQVRVNRASQQHEHECYAMIKLLEGCPVDFTSVAPNASTSALKQQYTKCEAAQARLQVELLHHARKLRRFSEGQQQHSVHPLERLTASTEMLVQVLHETLAIDRTKPAKKDILNLLYPEASPASLPRCIGTPTNPNVHLQASGMQAVCAESKGSDFILVADTCIPEGVEEFYFEAHIVKQGRGEVTCVGFIPKGEEEKSGTHLGWGSCGIGYHGDDGQIYGHSSGHPKFGTGNTIGVSYCRSTQTVTWWRDGELVVSVTYKEVRELFPSVSTRRGAIIELNFGESPFVHAEQEAERQELLRQCRVVPIGSPSSTQLQQQPPPFSLETLEALFLKFCIDGPPELRRLMSRVLLCPEIGPVLGDGFCNFPMEMLKKYFSQQSEIKAAGFPHDEVFAVLKDMVALNANSPRMRISLLAAADELLTTSAADNNGLADHFGVVGWALLLLSHYLAIPAELPVVHPGSVCAVTGMSPIVGVRYKCAVTNNFDICEQVERLGAIPGHVFLRIPRPLPILTEPLHVAASRKPQCVPLLPSSFAATESGTGVVVEHGIECDYCGQQIVGPRYLCVNCDDFNMCDKCTQKGVDHFTDHIFLVIRELVADTPPGHTPKALISMYHPDLYPSDPASPSSTTKRKGLNRTTSWSKVKSNQDQDPENPRCDRTRPFLNRGKRQSALQPATSAYDVRPMRSLFGLLVSLLDLPVLPTELFSLGCKVLGQMALSCPTDHVVLDIFGNSNLAPFLQVVASCADSWARVAVIQLFESLFARTASVAESDTHVWQRETLVQATCLLPKVMMNCNQTITTNAVLFLLELSLVAAKDYASTLKPSSALSSPCRSPVSPTTRSPAKLMINTVSLTNAAEPFEAHRIVMRSLMAFLEMLPGVPLADYLAVYAFLLRLLLSVGPTVLLHNTQALSAITGIILSAKPSMSNVLRQDLTALFQPLLLHSQADDTIKPMLIKVLQNLFENADCVSGVVVDLLQILLLDVDSAKAFTADPEVTIKLFDSLVCVADAKSDPNSSTASDTELSTTLLFTLFAKVLAGSDSALFEAVLLQALSALEMLISWLCRCTSSQRPVEGADSAQQGTLFDAAAGFMETLSHSSPIACAVCLDMVVGIIKTSRPQSTYFLTRFLLHLLHAESIEHFTHQLGGIELLRNELVVQQHASSHAFSGTIRSVLGLSHPTGSGAAQVQLLGQATILSAPLMPGGPKQLELLLRESHRNLERSSRSRGCVPLSWGVSKTVVLQLSLSQAVIHQVRVLCVQAPSGQALAAELPACISLRIGGHVDRLIPCGDLTRHPNPLRIADNHAHYLYEIQLPPSSPPTHIVELIFTQPESSRSLGVKFALSGISVAGEVFSQSHGSSLSAAHCYEGLALHLAAHCASLSHSFCQCIAQHADLPSILLCVLSYLDSPKFGHFALVIAERLASLPGGFVADALLDLALGGMHRSAATAALAGQLASSSDVPQGAHRWKRLWDVVIPLLRQEVEDVNHGGSNNLLPCVKALAEASLVVACSDVQSADAAMLVQWVSTSGMSSRAQQAGLQLLCIVSQASTLPLHHLITQYNQLRFASGVDSQEFDVTSTNLLRMAGCMACSSRPAAEILIQSGMIEQVVSQLEQLWQHWPHASHIWKLGASMSSLHFLTNVAQSPAIQTHLGAAQLLSRLMSAAVSAVKASSLSPVLHRSGCVFQEAVNAHQHNQRVVAQLLIEQLCVQPLVPFVLELTVQLLSSVDSVAVGIIYRKSVPGSQLSPQLPTSILKPNVSHNVLEDPAGTMPPSTKALAYQHVCPVLFAPASKQIAKWLPSVLAKGINWSTLSWSDLNGNKLEPDVTAERLPRTELGIALLYYEAEQPVVLPEPEPKSNSHPQWKTLESFDGNEVLYRQYLKDVLKEDMQVLCVNGYEVVEPGDTGSFKQWNDGTPPVQVEWRSYGAKYWVYWRDIEIVEATDGNCSSSETAPAEDAEIEDEEELAGSAGVDLPQSVLAEFVQMGGVEQLVHLAHESAEDEKRVEWLQELRHCLDLPSFRSSFIRSRRNRELLFGTLTDPANAAGHSTADYFASYSDTLVQLFTHSNEVGLRSSCLPLVHKLLLRLQRVSKEVPRVKGCKELTPPSTPEPQPPAVPKQPEELSLLSAISIAASECKSPSSTPSTPFGKKGKGYGYDEGSPESSPSWDPQVYLQEQRALSTQICSLLSIFGAIMDPADEKLPDELIDVFQHSCFLPLIEGYLRNDSLMDMLKSADIYMVISRILRVFCRRRELNFLLMPLPAQPNSLGALTGLLIKPIAFFIKQLPDRSDAEASPSDEVAQLATELSEVCSMVQQQVEQYQASQKAIDEEGETSVTPAHTPAAAEDGNGLGELQEQYEEMLAEYRFDEMDMAGEDGKYAGHHYQGTIREEPEPASTKMLRLAQEVGALCSALPVSIHCSTIMRCDEMRMDVLKALIFGPTDTPYESGVYEFDLYCPPNYPNAPPKVNLQTTGKGAIRFNPNLYNCGKVCLSLLGTWSGATGENWDPSVSTLLQVSSAGCCFEWWSQVIVSIQSLIMVDEPYFNEPGYEREQSTDKGERKNLGYSNIIRYGNLKYAIAGQLRSPPSGFAKPIRRHFWLKKDLILAMCDTWSAEAHNKEPSAVKPDYSGLVGDHNSSLAGLFSKGAYPRMLDEEIAVVKEELAKLDERVLEDGSDDDQ